MTCLTHIDYATAPAWQIKKRFPHSTRYPWIYDKATDEEFEDKTRVIVQCCAFGDNFYDYDEREPSKWDVDFPFEGILENPCVEILSCCDCCGCAGW